MLDGCSQILRNKDYLYVKQRVGHLSYMADPQVRQSHTSRWQHWLVVTALTMMHNVIILTVQIMVLFMMKKMVLFMMQKMVIFIMQNMVLFTVQKILILCYGMNNIIVEC